MYTALRGDWKHRITGMMASERDVHERWPNKFVWEMQIIDETRALVTHEVIVSIRE